MANLFHRQLLVKYYCICDGKMSLSKMPMIFVENVIFFGGKCFRLTFYNGIKMSVASEVLIMTTEEKLLKLLTLVMALVCQKCKTYIFYGVSICNKQSAIVNIKEGIIYDDKRNTVGTINTCDGFCALKIQNIFFFMVLLFATNIIPS